MKPDDENDISPGTPKANRLGTVAREKYESILHARLLRCIGSLAAQVKAHEDKALQIYLEQNDLAAQLDTYRTLLEGLLDFFGDPDWRNPVGLRDNRSLFHDPKVVKGLDAILREMPDLKPVFAELDRLQAIKEQVTEKVWLAGAPAAGGAAVAATGVTEGTVSALAVRAAATGTVTGMINVGAQGAQTAATDLAEGASLQQCVYNAGNHITTYGKRDFIVGAAMGAFETALSGALTPRQAPIITINGVKPSTGMSPRSEIWGLSTPHGGPYPGPGPLAQIVTSAVSDFGENIGSSLVQDTGTNPDAENGEHWWSDSY